MDNTDEVGLREVINDEEVEEVFAVLGRRRRAMPANPVAATRTTSRSSKSGDIYQVAEVVRTLSIRDKGQGPLGRREADVAQRPADSRRLSSPSPSA